MQALCNIPVFKIKTYLSLSTFSPPLSFGDSTFLSSMFETVIDLTFSHLCLKQ